MSKINTGVTRSNSRVVQIDGSVATPEILNGGLKINESTDATEKTISWDDTQKKYKYHNGVSWVFFGGGGGYEDFASDPTDTFTHVFAGIESLANYTAFASDPTEVFGFDTEAQP